MYLQFFGNYLLNEKLITPDDLIEALQELKYLQTKIGELAVRYGYLTAEQAEQIHLMQTHKDKRFGELAVEEGMLTEEEMAELLNKQKKGYEILCKILCDNGSMELSKGKEALDHYLTKYLLPDSTTISTIGTGKDITSLIKHFYHFERVSNPELASKYVQLLFNNYVRFIGSDFTISNPYILKEIPTGYCCSQLVLGAFSAYTGIIMDFETMIDFASRYADIEFDEVDEYVTASLEDFMNLHNGLFTVNVSNEDAIELTLDVPLIGEFPEITAENPVYCIPVSFAFGVVTCMISIRNK